MSSKLIANQKDFFSKMVVDAVMLLDELLPLNMIGMKKVSGGALEVYCLKINIYAHNLLSLLCLVRFLKLLKRSFKYMSPRYQPSK